VKTCTKCKESKELEGFYKEKHRKDGLSPWCKACCLSKDALYRTTHKKEKSIRMAIYKLENREEISVKNSIYREKNKEEIAEQKISYYLENKEAILTRQANYYAENKKVLDARISIWGKNNRGKINAIAARRRAQKLLATPKWLTKGQLEEILSIYLEAARLTKETGIKHHVDHIIPLQGENVTGLHVPWNLQILTATENCRKGNKFD
jgi:5-methylcytosine-specific restriction endonuclease McrA